MLAFELLFLSYVLTPETYCKPWPAMFLAKAQQKHFMKMRSEVSLWYLRLPIFLIALEKYYSLLKCLSLSTWLWAILGNSQLILFS